MENINERIRENKLSGSKFYLTIHGLEKIKQDLIKFKEARSLRLIEEVPEFLHSEEPNPEYLAFQDDINPLDEKIIDLGYILKNYELIKAPPKEERDKVHIGAKVIVEADGKKDEFEIVDTLEADPLEGRISKDSPVGHALLGHSVGEEVAIFSPVEILFKIRRIKYPVLYLKLNENLV